MPLEILKPDLTPLGDLAITNLEAGEDSDVVEFVVRNATGQDIFDALLVIRLEHPTVPGRFVSAGFPPQDELWARVRLTGQTSAAAPAQQNLTTDWTPIGAYAALLIPNVLAGGIRTAQLKMRPPSNASLANWRWDLSTIEIEHARAVPPALTLARRGILTGVGEASWFGLVRGGAVTASAPADADVHVAPALWVHRGRVRGKVASVHALNQNDGAAAALAAAQSYWAVLSLGAAGVTVTKGLKAAAPTKPATPAGEALLRYVEVRYQAGGVSVIDAADISGTTVYDRHLVEAGAGLEALVNPGQALGGSSWSYWSTRQSIPLEDDATNRLWRLASGLFEVTTDDVPPEATALGPLAELVTAAGVVTSVTDRRTYADDTVVLHLRGNLPGAPGEIVSALVEHEALALEHVVYRISDNGGGAAGATILDLDARGATIYTGQATDDQRPTFGFNAAVLTDDDGYHEVTELRRGDVVSLRMAAQPVGGTPAWAEAYLVCRRW